MIAGAVAREWVPALAVGLVVLLGSILLIRRLIAAVAATPGPLATMHEEGDDLVVGFRAPHARWLLVPRRHTMPSADVAAMEVIEAGSVQHPGVVLGAGLQWKELMILRGRRLGHGRQLLLLRRDRTAVEVRFHPSSPWERAVLEVEAPEAVVDAFRASHGADALYGGWGGRT